MLNYLGLLKKRKKVPKYQLAPDNPDRLECVARKDGGFVDAGPKDTADRVVIEQRESIEIEWDELGEDDIDSGYVGIDLAEVPRSVARTQTPTDDSGSGEHSPEVDRALGEANADAVDESQSQSQSNDTSPEKNKEDEAAHVLPPRPLETEGAPFKIPPRTAMAGPLALQFISSEDLGSRSQHNLEHLQDLHLHSMIEDAERFSPDQGLRPDQRLPHAKDKAQSKITDFFPQDPRQAPEGPDRTNRSRTAQERDEGGTTDQRLPQPKDKAQLKITDYFPQGPGQATEGLDRTNQFRTGQEREQVGEPKQGKGVVRKSEEHIPRSAVSSSYGERWVKEYPDSRSWSLLPTSPPPSSDARMPLSTSKSEEPESEQDKTMDPDGALTAPGFVREQVQRLSKTPVAGQLSGRAVAGPSQPPVRHRQPDSAPSQESAQPPPASSSPPPEHEPTIRNPPSPSTPTLSIHKPYQSQPTPSMPLWSSRSTDRPNFIQPDEMNDPHPSSPPQTPTTAEQCAHQSPNARPPTPNLALSRPGPYQIWSESAGKWIHPALINQPDLILTTSVSVYPDSEHDTAGSHPNNCS